MADLLHTSSPAAGTTRLSEWAQAHQDTLGLNMQVSWPGGSNSQFET